MPTERSHAIPGADPWSNNGPTRPCPSGRLRIEHVNSRVKRCRMVKDRIRLWKKGVRDVVMEICCALHNFRVRLSPVASNGLIGINSTL